MLVGYGINISTKNVEIINGDFSTFKFSETESDSAEIHLKSNQINKTYTFPMVLDKYYLYSFGGKPTKSTSSIHGNNGKHGNNVTVMISEIVSKKEFFKIKISSRGKTESIYLNPNLGNLTIESIGSNGNQGKGGEDGNGNMKTLWQLREKMVALEVMEETVGISTFIYQNLLEYL